MNFEFLNGKNLKDDLIRIKDNLAKDPYVVFVYKSVANGRSLDAYLTAISDKDLAFEAGIKLIKHKSIINKLKICSERTDLKLNYYFENGRKGRVTSISQLIAVLNNFSKIKIVVINNSREDLAFTVQQLIYIGYPVYKLKIMLKNEQDKFDEFTNGIDELLDRCHNAIIKVDKLLNKAFSDKKIFNETEIFNHLSRTLDYCFEIEKELERETSIAEYIEMGIEVAASKKTGKSVIVNSMLGEQLAPSSLTQATPNTCIFRRSPDNMYYLQTVKFDENSEHLLPTSEKLIFYDRESIFKEINEEFKKAEQNAANNFSTDDMEISYPQNNSNIFQSYTIYDTPGPNAAGTSHSKSVEYALKHSDVALFALDYTKYLTTDEFNYLETVKSHFDKNNKFHSLVFALNKVDMRYTDGSDVKSIIRDTEFIRNRIISIDPKFKECIIFPISALIYLNTLIAEKAYIPELLESKCLEKEFQQIAMEYGDDVEELISLMNYTNNLSMLSGVQNITLEKLKQDSGMPALLSYIDYIAKCRTEEIMYDHFTQCRDMINKKIDMVFDYIEDVEKIMEQEELICKIKIRYNAQ